ncbi:oxidative stress-induced growth inhibitor 1-like isoform X2 [Plodia interpunctella]|nr:oxidative stress-induced growth inhibitor 1-like isoform X2 [Plodia interpunctella]
MLAGNVPYLKQIPDDLPVEEMLKARLSNLPVGQNLYETDLLELAEGLEGRSQNPVPLLMDNLLRPCADLGIQADPLIEWKYDVEKQIDHIVLGRGPAGGAWAGFPAGVRTLSPSAWLTLPPHAPVCGDRLPASAVADYYRRYVRATKLKRYFRNGVVVTSVRCAPRPLTPPCSRACPLAAVYCVAGFDKSEGRPFRYLCRRVVLACGAGDRPNTLEPNIAKYSLHSLADFQTALQNSEPSEPPVLAVGSGVSCADATRLSARAARAVAHVHRAPARALARLEPALYPGYYQIYKMMCDGENGNYPNYKSYPNHVIVDVTPEEAPPHSDPRKNPTTRPKRVKLLNVATNELTEIIVSIIIVLIGSKPDLFFLQTNFNLNCIELDSECIKCTDNQVKKKIEDSRQWFLKEHWHYIKTVLGQSIQSCKSRLNSTEINGNTNTKCVLPDCNKRSENKCTCNNLISKLENGIIKTNVENDKCVCDYLEKVKCRCPTNSYSNGVGFGIDPKQPVDGRNPIAIDKSTHELLNAPKGIYALGPLTADNFVRFIPGGALAIVAHIHKEKTAE